MNDDLLISIGADLSSFASAMKEAEAAFKRLNSSIQRDPIKISVASMVKDVQKEQKAYERFRKKILEIDASITQEQIQEMFKRDQAYKQHLQRQARMKRVQANELRGIESEITKQTKLPVDEVKQYYGGVERLGHAIRTTALYGGVAQVLFGLQSAIGDTIGAVIQFDKMIAQNVGVLQLSRAEATKLAYTVEDLGKKYGNAFGDIQQAMLTLGRAGVASQDIEKYTESVIALAQITGDTLGESAEAVASYREVFREAAKDVEFFSGKMAYIANETVLSMANFKVIGNYALSASQAMGLTYDSLLSLIGAMSKVGKQSSTIGTTIRRLGTALKDQSDVILNTWRKLGFEQEKVAASMRVNSDYTVRAIAKSLAAMTPEKYRTATKDLNVLMKDMFDTLRDIGKSGFFEKFSGNYVDAIEQAQKVTASFEDNINKVKNRFLSAATAVGIDFIQELNKFIDTSNKDGKEAIDNLIKGFERFARFALKAITVVATGISTLVAVISLAGSGLTILAGKVGEKGAELFGGVTPEDYEEAQKKHEALRKKYDKAPESTLEEYEARKKIKEEAQEYYDIMVKYQAKGTAQQILENSRAITVEGQKNAKQTEDLITSIGELGNELIKASNATGIGTNLKEATENAKQLKKALPKKGEGADLSAVIEPSAEAKAAMTMTELYTKALKENWDAARLSVEKYNIRIAGQEKIVADAKNKVTKDTLVSEEAYTTLQKEQAKLAQLEYDRNKLIQSQREQGAQTAKDEIRTIMQTAEMEKLKAEYYALEAGGIMTTAEARAFDTKIAEENLRIAEDALIKARAIANENDPKSMRELARAEKKYWQEKVDYIKIVKKDILDMNKTMQSVGESFADSLLGGDIRGAFKNLFKDIYNVFTQPLKEEFAKLFGNDMTSLVQGFYNKLTQFVQTWAIEGFAAAIKVAQGNATAAVANQASSGDPYSAWARMAAMAATMAAMGLITGFSGGGGLTEAEREAAKGRTTGFDDQSIEGLKDALESAQYPLLDVTYKMYQHIRSMDTNFVSVAKALTGTTAGLDITGAGFIPKFDETLWGAWSTTQTSLLGSGLEFFGDTITDYMYNLQDNIKTFMTVLEETDYVFGLFSSTDTTTTYGFLDPSVAKSLQDAFREGYVSILESAAVLGFDRAAIDKAMKAVQLEIDKISFEGLSEEEVAARLQNVFGEIFSSLVAGVPALEELASRYSKGGEALYETLGRIAIEYEQASFAFSLIGKEFTDRAVTFGSVFANAIMQIIDKVEGTTKTLYTAQEQILDVVDAIGGLEAFNDAMSSFISNFYTDAEQIEIAGKALEAQFKTLGIEMPSSKEEFKDLILGFQITNEASAETYAQLLKLGEGFAEWADGMEELTRTTLNNVEMLLDYIDSRADFTTRYLTVTGASETELAEYAVTAAELRLDAIKQLTGIENVTLDTYAKQFEIAHLSNQLTQEQLDNWTTLGDALLNVAEAQKALNDILEDSVDASTFKAIGDAWLSSLSYLTDIQKTAFADSYYDMMRELKAVNEEVSVVDAARSAAEAAMKTTATKEEFIPYFERYINALEDEVKDATLLDVVNKLDDVIDIIRETSDDSLKTITDVRIVQ